MAYQNVIYDMERRYAHAVGMIGRNSTKRNPNVLSKPEFIDGIRQLNPRIADYIEESVRGIEDPVFELYGKCTAFYNIGAMKIKGKGGKVVGKGAISFEPSLDNADHYNMKFDLNLPGDRKIIGFRESGNTLECRRYASDGSVIKEQLSTEGRVVSRLPMDTRIVKKEGDHYLNSEGITVACNYTDLTELFQDGSVLTMRSWGDRMNIKFRNDYTHHYREFSINPEGDLEVSARGCSKSLTKGYPDFIMTLNDDMKMTAKYVGYGYPYYTREYIANYSKPRSIPDEILNLPGFKEILERLKVMRQIQSESEEHLDFYNLLEKFSERFYGSQLEKAEKAVPNKSTQPTARNDSRGRYPKFPVRF